MAVLYHRTSDRLRDAVAAEGPTSAALPALVVLGLAALGRDVAALRPDVAAAILGGQLAPDLAVQLEALFFAAAPASTVQAARLQAASEAQAAEDDPFAGLGFAFEG